MRAGCVEIYHTIVIGFQKSLWNEWRWEVAMKEAKGQPSWKISAALHTSADIFHNILRSDLSCLSFPLLHIPPPL